MFLDKFIQIMRNKRTEDKCAKSSGEYDLAHKLGVAYINMFQKHYAAYICSSEFNSVASENLICLKCTNPSK